MLTFPSFFKVVREVKKGIRMSSGLVTMNIGRDLLFYKVDLSPPLTFNLAMIWPLKGNQYKQHKVSLVL